MPDPIVSQGIGYLLSQGVLGICVIGLAWLYLQTRRDLIEQREAHKVEIAAERALNANLNGQLLEEAKQGYEIAASTKSTLDAFLRAIQN